MSPPGKRRHNELNAAPPPETPQGTGKPGAVSDRDGVKSGKVLIFGAKAVNQQIQLIFLFFFPLFLLKKEVGFGATPQK